MLRQGGEYHRGSEKWKKQVGRAKSERDEMNDLIEQRAKSLHIPSEKIHEVTSHLFVPFWIRLEDI